MKNQESVAQPENMSETIIIDEQFAITLNDALGSIGQYTRHRAKEVKVAQAKFDKFNELIKLADKEEDLIEILKNYKNI